MSTDLIIILLVIILGFAGLASLIYSLLNKSRAKDPQELEDMINKVFGMSAQKISQQSKQVLESEREAIDVNLENKQKAIEKIVQELKTDMKERQEEIRSLEQDRVKKFGELTSQLENHREIAQELKISTQALSKVLSNNQQRGAWGERIIEDLMQSNGLVEGVHYLRQTTQGDLRPDIVLLLPNKRNVPVDVKFPYSEIQKMAVAEGKAQKDTHLKQFAKDLKSKIKKVASYIDPEQETLDYAIMFVPNEMVFSFINQKFPEIVDEAISQRVIIVSPFTFLIVARTVMESYRNFMMEDKLKDVVRYVDGFVKEWGKFKDQLDKYGRSIDTLQRSYGDLVNTRVKQMDRRIEKIGGLEGLGEGGEDKLIGE